MAIRREPQGRNGMLRAASLSLILVGSGVLYACYADRESPHPSTPELPRLTLERTTEIGGAGATGPFALGSATAAALDPALERVAILDGLTQLVHVFTVEGEYIRSLGGEGWGPGESKAARNIAWRADGGLCLWDVQVLRITQFGATGRVEATAEVRDPDIRRRPRLVGFFDDCTGVIEERILAGATRRQQQGPIRDTLRYVLLDSDGSARRTLATRPEVEKWWRRFSDGNGRKVGHIFGADVQAIVVGQELWLGDNRLAGWEQIRRTGEGGSSVSAAIQGRPVTPEDVRRERARRLDTVPVPRELGGPVRERILEYHRRGTEEVPAEDTTPAYDHIVPGVDRFVWIRRHPLATDTVAEWVALAPDGAVFGSFELHRNARVLAASRDLVVSLTRDEHDAAVVTVWSRSGAQGIREEVSW